MLETSKLNIVEEETPSELGQKLSFPAETEPNLNARGTQGVEEMRERARQIDPSLDTPRNTMDYQDGTDKRPNEIVAANRNARLREARTLALGDLLSNPETADAALFMPTDLEPADNAVHKEYGTALGNTIATRSSVGAELDEERQAKFAEVMDNMITQQSRMRDLTVRLMEEKGRNETVFHKGWQFALSLVPLSDRTAILATELPQGSFFAGNSFRDGIEYIYAQPDPVEAAERVVRDLDRINPNTATDFLMALNSHSSWDLMGKNIFDGIDIATAGVTVKVAKALAAGGRSVLKNGPSVPKMAEELGENTTAAAAELAQDVRDAKLGKGAYAEGGEAAGANNEFLPIKDPEKLLGTPLENLENEIFPDSSAHLAKRKLMERFGNEQQVERSLDIVRQNGTANAREEDLAFLIKEGTEDFLMNDIKSPGKNVLNFGVKPSGETFEYTGHPLDRLIRGENFADNSDRLGFTLGDNEGDLFKTMESADQWAQNYLKISDYQIRGKGTGGYYILVQKPVDVRRLYEHSEQSIKLNKEKGPQFLRSLFSASMRGSQERVLDARYVADNSAFTGSAMGEAIAKTQSMKKVHQQEMVDVLNATRDWKHPTTGKYVWPSDKQFHEEFTRLHGKAPTDTQVDAYNEMRNGQALTHAMREMVAIGQYSKAGIRHWTLFNGKMEVRGRRVPRDQIRKYQGQDVHIGVYDKGGRIDDTWSSLKGNLSKNGLADLEKKMDEGWELIEAAHKTFDIGETRHTHILVPPNAGKHRDVRFGEYLGEQGGVSKILTGRGKIKSADVKNGVMGQDHVWFTVDDWGAADNLVERMNKAGAMFRAGKMAEFDKYVSESIPEMNGGMKHKVKWDSEFKVTNTDTNLADDAAYMDRLTKDHKGLFVGNSTRQAPDSNISKRFTQPREDATELTVRYNEGNGVELAQATLLNPIDSVLAGMRHAFDEAVYAGYIDKHTALFMREYSEYLHTDTKNAFMGNPLAAMTNPKWSGDTPPWVKAQAAALARVTNNLLQMPTPSAQWLNRYTTYLSEQLNRAFPHFTKKGVGKWIDERLLHTTNDPTSFWRGITFHSKLGFFNPKQLVLQGFMIGNVAAIEGPHRMYSALKGYYISTGLKFTASEDIIQDAAQKLAKDSTEWKKPEWFLESHKAMRGFDEVASNTALYDAHAGPKSKGRIGSAIAKTTDTGLYTFKKGEQTARVTAWHAAYLNWRKTHGDDAVFDAAAQRWVRGRASDLTVNMTRDMNAAYQRGLPALGTQFWSFQMNTMAQMLFGAGAGTLKPADRIRLAAYYSTMFGLPVGLSSAIPWEFHETAREMMAEYGIKDEDHPMIETMRDGLYSAMLSFATGEDYDVTNLAPGGLPVFKDAWDYIWGNERHNKELFDFLGGATFSTVAQVGSGVMKAYETMNNLFDMYNGNPDMQPTVTELLAPFEAITSVGFAKKFYMATRIGEYITRYETNTGIPYTQKDAIIEAITGAQTDAKLAEYAKKATIKEWQDESKAQRQEMQRLFNMANQAFRAGDDEEGYRLHRRAVQTGTFEGMSKFELLKQARRTWKQGVGTDKTAETYDRLMLERVYRDQRKRQREQETQ